MSQPHVSFASKIIKDPLKQTKHESKEDEKQFWKEYEVFLLDRYQMTSYFCIAMLVVFKVIEFVQFHGQFDEVYI